MRPEFKIGERLVGPEHPPLVIAEIGINHEGKLEEAKKLVDSAARAGAEIIKHQTHILDAEMCEAAKSVKPGNATISIYEVMERCHLSEEDEFALQEYTHSKGMMYFSTPISTQAVDRLVRMNVPAFKLGSGDCNNFPLLDYVASQGKPIILSTGMVPLTTVDKAVAILRSHKVPFALLHCTNVYPAPYHLIRLNGVTQLQERYPDAVVGLSDHSLSNYPCLGAVALGGSVLERHYTDNKDRIGPDIPVSMTEQECKDLIYGSRAIWEARGGDKNVVLDEEEAARGFSLACVVAIKPIRAGEKLTKDNVWVKRPANGEISAQDFEKVLGQTAKTDIPFDAQLKWEHMTVTEKEVEFAST